MQRLHARLEEARPPDHERSPPWWGPPLGAWTPPPDAPTQVGMGTPRSAALKPFGGCLRYNTPWPSSSNGARPASQVKIEATMHKEGREPCAAKRPSAAPATGAPRWASATPS